MSEPIIKPRESRTSGSEARRAPVVSIETSSGFKRAPVPTEEIYHSPDLLGSPYLRNALSLISRALTRVDEALAALKDEDRIAADDSMQHCCALFPELFVCRRIGEGFALIASSLQNAAMRRQGRAMDEPHIRAVRSALVSLRSEPFMTFDAALDQVSRLERVGLNIAPPKFEELSKLLSE